jgi:N-acetylglucosaminyldiphosphoundecaprenol N-acetyl-beta-D-mannosaminyltransferase
MFPGLRIIQFLVVVQGPAHKTRRPDRVNVLGVAISAINLDSALSHVSAALENRIRGYVCVTGVHGVSEAQTDSAFRSILNCAFLNTPDGVPMVWMGRLQGFSNMGRVYGPDLMLKVCEFTQSSGHKHFFYGGGPGVADQLHSQLKVQFPRLNVVGTFTPPYRPLTDLEEQSLIDRVSKAKPDIIWVGLSTPKQERFMAGLGQRLETTLLFGVGAAFDFHTGRVRQAPRWMQRSGLEWLFRLSCEPTRLWKRYLKNNPLFVLRALGQLSCLKRYTLE